MLRDPYRRLFLEANAASHPIVVEAAGFSGPGAILSGRLGLGLGSRLLVAGLTDPGILPGLRLRLGLTGQLMVIDPSQENLGAIPGDDAFWAVVLKAQASQLPNLDSSLDAILCWSSFMGLGPLGRITEEFFRVLAPGGRVFVAYAGRALADRPRPCLVGMERLFLQAGFSRLDLEEDEDLWLFRAEKVAGFDLSLSMMGRA
jgi:SAM-dependent methyltransferase